MIFGFVDKLLKRAERRIFREAENALTKKVKHTLFGPKEKKIELGIWVQYKRIRSQVLDIALKYTYRDKINFKNYCQVYRSEILEVIKEFKKAGKNLGENELDRLEHRELMKQLEEASVWTG